MRFIRKGGRVIPIKDDSFYKTPRGKASQTVSKLGTAAAVTAAGSHVMAAAQFAVSDLTGKSAIVAAKASKKAAKIGGLVGKVQASSFASSARRLATASLSAGAKGNKYAKIAKVGAYAAAGLWTAGAALSIHKLPKRKGK